MAAYVKEFQFGTEMTGSEGESAGCDADTDSIVNAMDDILSFGDDTEISDIDGGGSAKTESIADSGSEYFYFNFRGCFSHTRKKIANINKHSNKGVKIILMQ